MNITKRSMVSGKEHTLDIPVTEDQLLAWHSGVHIQDAMPNLTPDQREFLMTGITAEEWEETMSDEDEGGDDDDPIDHEAEEAADRADLARDDDLPF